MYKRQISTLLNLAPVGDARYFYFPDFVINGVDHAVIADADAPQVFSADELFAAIGSGVCGKRLDFWEDAARYRVG